LFFQTGPEDKILSAFPPENEKRFSFEMLWYKKLKMMGSIENSTEIYDIGWRRLDPHL
jgi:hypothetical protein